MIQEHKENAILKNIFKRASGDLGSWYKSSKRYLSPLWKKNIHNLLKNVWRHFIFIIRKKQYYNDVSSSQSAELSPKHNPSRVFTWNKISWSISIEKQGHQIGKTFINKIYKVVAWVERGPSLLEISNWWSRQCGTGTGLCKQGNRREQKVQK